MRLKTALSLQCQCRSDKDLMYVLIYARTFMTSSLSAKHALVRACDVVAYRYRCNFVPEFRGDLLSQVLNVRSCVSDVTYM